MWLTVPLLVSGPDMQTEQVVSVFLMFIFWQFMFSKWTTLSYLMQLEFRVGFIAGKSVFKLFLCGTVMTQSFR